MLKIGIVGLGRIAQKHGQILTENKVKGVKLIAGCDIKEHRLNLFTRKYGISGYSDMVEMVTKENLDIVTISTESGNHAKHAIKLAPYVKTIIVEKPMALTLEDADKMISECDKHGTKLFVIKQNRFNPPVVELKKAIENNGLGKLTLGTIRMRWCREQKYYDQDAWRGTYHLDGGVLSQQCSHSIDMLEWMMGDVESVFAKAGTYLVDIEAEDTAIVLLRFNSGALGIIEATTATRPDNLEGSISILGENGTVVIGGIATNKLETWKLKDKELEEKYMIENYSSDVESVYGKGHVKYYENVIDCINGKGKALVDGLEGRKSLELISAIYESIETGEEVFLRFKPKKCKLGIG